MEFNGVNPAFHNNDYLRNEQFSKFGHDKQHIINHFKQIALEFTNEFASQIPGFGELDENDRKVNLLGYFQDDQTRLTGDQQWHSILIHSPLPPDLDLKFVRGGFHALLRLPALAWPGSRRVRRQLPPVQK